LEENGKIVIIVQNY